MKKQHRLWLYSSAGAGLVLGCLVLLNLLAGRFPIRADLSAGGLYSLSSGSRRILASLDVPVEIRVYFSKQLPPEYETRRTYLQDLLTEYQEASGGKVRARYIDVDKDQETKQKALSQGIAPVEFNVISKEKFEVRQGFMGLVLQHEDKKEVLPVIVESEALEYNLTSRILQMTREKKKIVGLVSSHGALSPEGLHPQIRELLEHNYELRPIDLRGLTPGATITAEISALMVLGPSEELPDYHLYTLDQFLLSGRPMVIALDPRKVDLQAFVASPLSNGMPALLKHYGLTLGKNYVLDAQNQRVQVSQQRGWMRFMNLIDYPLFIVATDLDKKHPITRHLNALTLPLSSNIEVSTAIAATRADILVRSSKHSWQSTAWGRGAVHSISPLQEINKTEQDPKGPFALAVAVKGPFQSFFDASNKAAPPRPKEADAGAYLAKSSSDARVIVVGTSRFAHPDMPVGETGAAFLFNLVDWMALDSDLISIRSKSLLLRPLREIPPRSKQLIRWLNILGPSLAVMLFGFARRKLRLNRRAYRMETYLPRPKE